MQWVAMKIYTGTGDNGETSLFSGQRVQKNHPRVAAYGALDEMNSALGAAAASSHAEEIETALIAIQRLVFDLCADLATIFKPGQTPRITTETIDWIEKEMDALDGKLPELDCFVLPGGSPAAAHIHVARTIARRAEREACSIPEQEPAAREPLVFLNRLSDYLFLLARRENQLSGTKELEWRPAKLQKKAAGASGAGG